MSYDVVRKKFKKEHLNSFKNGAVVTVTIATILFGIGNDSKSRPRASYHHSADETYRFGNTKKCTLTTILVFDVYMHYARHWG